MNGQDPAYRDAMIFLESSFPHLSPYDRAPLIAGLGAVLWPHFHAAGVADMADDMADRFPDIAAALDQASYDRRQELAKGAQP